MKTRITLLFLSALMCMFFISCTSDDKRTDVSDSSVNTETSISQGAGQSSVQDDISQKNIVQIASGSKDHTTLVAAIKAADLVNALSNAGPFTVFAPTNEAFDKLPKGTLDELLKKEKISDLQNILQYHVSVAVYKTEIFQDGQILGQVNGDKVTIKVNGEKITVNGANILASIPASNGIIHVIDAVLLPTVLE